MEGNARKVKGDGGLARGIKRVKQSSGLHFRSGGRSSATKAQRPRSEARIRASEQRTPTTARRLRAGNARLRGSAPRSEEAERWYRTTER